MLRIVEIRSYNLKPGTRDTFAELMRDRARPMLVQHGTDVVAAGLSRAEENSAFIIRAYRDVVERDSSQAVFYGSDAWRQGPREAVLACIENYTTIVLEADEATIDGLRDGERVATK